MELIGRYDDHRIQPGMAKQLPVIGISGFYAHFIACFAELFFIHIANGDQARLLVVLDCQHMALSHVAAGNYTHIQNLLFHPLNSL